MDTLRGNAGIHYRELSAVREKVTAEDVKYHLQGMKQGQETLLPYFCTHSENFDRRVGINKAKSTAGSYRNAFNHLANFLNEKYNLSDVPFPALDRSFIDKFD